MDGTISVDSLDDSVAFCYSDSQSNLILALWQANDDRSDSLYQATMSSDFAQSVNGCASIELQKIDELHKLSVLVYTDDYYLGLLNIQFGESTFSSLDSSDSLSMSVVLRLSSQKFFILNTPTNLQFTAVPGFISINTSLYGNQDKWAFILNTDLKDLRETTLWV